jgi:hypothetical protein
LDLQSVGHIALQLEVCLFIWEILFASEKEMLNQGLLYKSLVKLSLKEASFSDYLVAKSKYDKK